MSKLYVVPTPIGNLKDITLRALEVLKSVDIILAEDTRKTGILLKHYGIEKRCLSYHKFNEHKILEKIIPLIRQHDVALVSEAGTPGISDPGYLIINRCIAENIEVETLPGPTALIPALINSGFPSDMFLFAGFLPHKKGRIQKLQQLKNIKQTVILYESPHRLLRTLMQIEEVFGSNQYVSVSRELSKIHEENKRGTVIELIQYFTGKSIRGECVIVISRQD